MKKQENHTKRPIEQVKKEDFSYPPNEDIYRNYVEETEINPEDISLMKEPNENNQTTTWNEKSFEDDETKNDLDVPGSELDDEQENIGSEDEENNYYSIGGDNHDDLEEQKDE